MKLKLSIALLAVMALVLFGSIGLNVRFLLSSQAASEAPSSISSENSYVFASPLMAQANGNDRIRINVFVLNSTGLGVKGQTVTLSAPGGITIMPIQSESDQYGKTVFDVTSDQNNSYVITAKVNDKKIGETVTVKFQ